MALLLDDVTAYLAASGLGLTFGTNLFAGLLPDSPDACVAVFEYPGESPMEVMGPSNTGAPAIEVPHLQALVRGALEDYVTPRTLINGIWKTLNKVVNQTLSGTYYERIEAIQSPFFLHRDNSRRVFFAANFRVMKTPG